MWFVKKSDVYRAVARIVEARDPRRTCLEIDVRALNRDMRSTRYLCVAFDRLERKMVMPWNKAAVREAKLEVTLTLSPFAMTMLDSVLAFRNLPSSRVVETVDDAIRQHLEMLGIKETEPLGRAFTEAMREVCHGDIHALDVVRKYRDAANMVAKLTRIYWMEILAKES